MMMSNISQRHRLRPIIKTVILANNNKNKYSESCKGAKSPPVNFTSAQIIEMGCRTTEMTTSTITTSRLGDVCIDRFIACNVA